MRALKFNLLIVALIAFTAYAANAQDKYEKTFHEEYGVDKNSDFEILNKFGNIVIENTKEDKITIDAEVVVKARSKDKADRIMEKISVSITKTGNTVRAETDIDNITSNNSSFEINYNVTMPAYLNIKLENKYGGVTINQLHGKSHLAVKYGSLNVNKINDDNDKPLSSVELGYCDGSIINEFNWGKVIIKYSKLQVMKGKALAISSKYSKLQLGEFSSVVAEAGYDDYKIESANNLVMEAKYSDINVGKLYKKFSIDNKYGNVTIEEVPNGFESIEVTSKYANINIGLEENANFTLEAKSSYADIKYDELNITQRIKEDFGMELKGTSGSNPKAAKVKIESEYGDIDLRP